MFSKILVANRGEVAVRIIRACKEMGIETVAVYSEADRNSLPVALADERICIGGNAAAESYLNQKNIISAARLWLSFRKCRLCQALRRKRHCLYRPEKRGYLCHGR